MASFFYLLLSNCKKHIACFYFNIIRLVLQPKSITKTYFKLTMTQHCTQEKKSIRKALIILLGIVIPFLVNSCKNEDIIEEIDKNEVYQSKLINFKGLPVKHRFITPEEDLEVEHNYGELKLIYNTQKRISKSGLKSNDSNSTTYNLPSVEEIAIEAKKHVDKYPFGNEKTVDEKWDMIKKDFPTLSDQEITENIDLIDEYYSQNLDYEIIVGLANNSTNEASNENSRSQSQISRVWCIITKFQDPNHMIAPIVSGGWINTGEFSYIRSLISIYFASTKAQSYSASEFPELGGTDTKRDAFRHVLWSSLLARNYWTITNKDIRIRFSEAVGNANEVCGENEIDGMNMDFHNNRVGRDIFDQNTSLIGGPTITYGLNIPTTETLVNLCRNKINDARFINESMYPSISDKVNQITLTDRNKAVYLK